MKRRRSGRGRCRPAFPVVVTTGHSLMAGGACCSGTVSLDEGGYGVCSVAVICQLEPHNLVHIAGRSLPALTTTITAFP